MLFRNLPALISLVAAFIVSIVTIIYKYDATQALLLILGAVILFYIIGLIIKALLNRFLAPEIPEETNDEEAAASESEDDKE